MQIKNLPGSYEPGRQSETIEDQPAPGDFPAAEDGGLSRLRINC